MSPRFLLNPNVVFPNPVVASLQPFNSVGAFINGYQ